LPSKDANDGVADPFIKVFYGDISPNVTKQGSELTEVGVSETINDDANPSWTKVFQVQWTKGAYQVHNLFFELILIIMLSSFESIDLN
jgi:hypothetical protein